MALCSRAISGANSTSSTFPASGRTLERRTQALAKVADQIAVVTKDVEAAGGDESLKAACLKPLEDLRNQIETQFSQTFNWPLGAAMSVTLIGSALVVSIVAAAVLRRVVR